VSSLFHYTRTVAHFFSPLERGNKKGCVFFSPPLSQRGGREGLICSGILPYALYVSPFKTKIPAGGVSQRGNTWFGKGYHPNQMPLKSHNKTNYKNKKSKTPTGFKYSSGHPFNYKHIIPMGFNKHQINNWLTQLVTKHQR
jgi:hypothetical protein